VPAWALAFSTAVVLALAGTPVLRRLAMATDLVDKPGNHKSHHIPTPYLGGVGVVFAVLGGAALDSRIPKGVAALVFSAAILGTVGLLDDDRNVDPRYRLVAQLAAAGVAAAVGVRIHATGVVAGDVVLTMLWIVGVTNALNLMDNMDGLAAGVAAVTAAAVFPLAILGQQPVLATLAAAMVGGCLGFLAYNRPPASIFLGDAGSLFLGFTVAVLTIEVTPQLVPPLGFAVPLLILGLPVLDTSTVTLARLRRGRSILEGGRDHLSHRLVALGLSRKAAVLTLIAVEAGMAALAVMAGRRVLPLGLAVLAAVVLLAVLSAATSRPEVYEEPVVGFPRPLKLGVLALAVVTPLLCVPGLLAVASAAGPARTGANAARNALDALSGSDATLTAAQFEQAGRAFAEAEDRLDGPLVSLGLAVPGMSSNLAATRTLVSSGRQLSETGVRLARISDGGSLRVSDGSVALDDVRSLAGDLGAAAKALHRTEDRLDEISRPFLLPPLQRAVSELDGRVRREIMGVDRAAEAARLLPAILGEGGTRRYFLAFQNNAEIRGGGGFMGSWGELTAQDGHVELGRFGRVDDLNSVNLNKRTLDMPFEFKKRWNAFQPQLFWQQVNISPDFPTTANMITQLYPQSGGEPLDGVIAIDPVGLSAMLELTGPVSVAGWPEPVSAGNVVDVTLKAAYERFEVRTEREQFLSDLSRTVADAFTTVDLGSPVRVAQALSRAVGEGHIFVHLNRAEEQNLPRNLGVDGAVPEVDGDSLLVVNQNVSANKVDYFLTRRLRYDVTLDPDRRPAALSGRLELTLENGAPAAGLPLGVIGPTVPQLVAGENRTYLSLYSPFPNSSATLDNQPLALTSDPDLGRQAHSATVIIPSLSSRTVVMEVAGRVRLTADGWYRLDLLHQPTLRPDDTEVSVTVPDGWRVVDTRGAEPVGDRRAEARIEQVRRHTVWVRVERTSSWGRLWDRLLDR